MTCEVCQQEFRCGCVSMPKIVETVLPCKKKPGGLFVLVRDQKGEAVRGAVLECEGERTTDGSGYAKWEELADGQHTVSMEWSKALDENYERPPGLQWRVGVEGPDVSELRVDLKQLAKLTVRVVNHLNETVNRIPFLGEGPKGFNGASSVLGDVIFDKLPGGDYSIKLSEDRRLKDWTPLNSPEKVTLAPGEHRTVTIKLQPKNQAVPENRVTPKIELEYRVALLDRHLAQHQDKEDGGLSKPDPTRIEISLEEIDIRTNGAYEGGHRPTKGGKITCPNVEIFLDEKCTQPLAGGTLTGEQLGSGTKLSLYLRGKTASKNNSIQVELNDQGDPYIVNGKAAEARISVVELRLTPHQYIAGDFSGLKADPNKPPASCDGKDYHRNLLAQYHKELQELTLPEQKEMSDREKIAGLGRLLSVQKGGSRARAKVTVSLKSEQWPDVPGDYVLQLGSDNRSGAVKVFDGETGGSALAMEEGIKVSDLLKEEKTLWIEGETAGGVQLDLSLHRGAGGIDHVAKRNGDVGRFTVVDFESMKVDFKPESGKPLRWNETTGRCYVNLVKGEDGRKFKFGVQLTQPVEGVRVYFALIPSPGNQFQENSGIDLPGGSRTEWNPQVPLQLFGSNAGQFEIRGANELWLREDETPGPDCEVYVGATYSDGGVAQVRYWPKVERSEEKSARLLQKFTETDFPRTDELLWAWDKVNEKVKHRDKKAPDEYFHLSALTNASGYATCDLHVSRYGGDIFTPACYIDQDPHLAKYVEDHKELGERGPFLAEKKMTVWRKIWLQKICVEEVPTPDFWDVVRKFEPLKVEIAKADDLEIPRTTVDEFTKQAIYPRYMIEPGGGNAEILVVSSGKLEGGGNKEEFFDLVKSHPDKPVLIPILVCHAQWDSQGFCSPYKTPPIQPEGGVLKIELVESDGGVLQPALNRRELAFGTLFVKTKEGTQKIDLGDEPCYYIDQNRQNVSEISIRVPEQTSEIESAWVEQFEVQWTKKYNGESFDGKILSVYNAKHPEDFFNTIAHEIGHAVCQIMDPKPSGNKAVPERAKTAPLGVPAHPKAVMGDGNHCRHQVNRCVMYDAGPTPGSLNQFCPVCHPYLLVVDMSEVK